MRSVLIISMILTISLSHAGTLPANLKVAVIFKKNNTLPYVSTRYIDYYKQGLKAAALQAKTMGLTIKFKFYTMEDIHKLKYQMDKVKKWEPNFIIGPNYSNAFLLLKNYFTETLVLSAFANDQSIASLPRNFYSINPLSEDYAEAMGNYIIENFPHSNIISIVETSCKSCFTLSNSFSRILQKRCPLIKIYPNYIDEFDMEKMQVSNLVKNYTKNDVVLILTTSDLAMTLIPQIANYLPYNITFIGSDTWGSAVDSTIGKVKSELKYTMVHIIPRSLSFETSELKQFQRNYKKLYGRIAEAPVSFAVYSTVNSVIIALKKCNKNNNDITNKVLSCYQLQLKDDPKAFYPKAFAVEQFSDLGTSVIATIPLNKKYYCNNNKHE